MKEKTNKKISAWYYLGLSFYAFLGLGMDGVLAGVEMSVYGKGLSEYTKLQSILHWIIICMIWGGFTYVLYRVSKKRGFDFMKQKAKAGKKQLVIAVLLTIIGIIEMTVSFGGFKPLIEFEKKTAVLFVFQYIYYLFEVALFLLILIFGQRFGEELFGKRKIPYGGIVLALTWGLIHILSKNLVTGIECIAFSIIFGILYLCVNKNTKLTYFFCACIFLL